MRDLLRDFAGSGGTVLLSTHLLHEIELVAGGGGGVQQLALGALSDDASAADDHGVVSFCMPPVSDLAVRSGWRTQFTPDAAQMAMTSTRPSRAVKSPGFLVYSGSSTEHAIAAIIKSTARAPRAFRPAAATAA